MENKLVWVGPRESDILYSGIKFSHSITFNGTNTNGNISLSSKIKTRIDHITAGSKWHLNGFLSQELKSFLADPEVQFLFYNPMQSYLIGNDIPKRTVCINERNLIDFFRNKANMRTFAQDCIPVIPYVQFTGHRIPSARFCTEDNDGYVLQKVHSSGGHGTFQMTFDECKEYTMTNSEAESYLLSPYLKYAVPINVHAVIFDQCCIIFPPSFQLIRRQGQNFSYVGGDFHTNFSTECYELIKTRSTALCEKLRLSGYRGVCGIDYMLTKNDVYFLEINARFQASSFLLNKLLLKEGKTSLHQLNFMAFSNQEPPFESFMQFQNPESFFTVSGDQYPAWFRDMETHRPSIISEVVLDGFSPEMELTPQAYLFRVITERNLCWLNPDFQLQLAPNIHQDSTAWRQMILSLDPLSIKIGLLNQGIRFSAEASHRIEQQGTIRAGVFQSVDLTLENGLIVNAPYHSSFSELSPYCIEWDGIAFFLSYEGIRLCRVTFDSADPYRDKIASGGTQFRNAAFWATDRLRVHHQFRCRYKIEGKGCRFCNVKLKKGHFSIEDVCSIIDFYLEHTQFRHFLIGGGSGTGNTESENIIALAQHIRSRSDKPIYAMCLPPADLSVLTEYYRAGINEIGFNLEIFDRKLAQEIMPGKGCIPLSQYEAAYREAVRLWGQTGAVRSLMVLGLESMESFYFGVEWLCQLGVMPIISVFRPVDNIELQAVVPLGNEELSRIFQNVKTITGKYGLVPGPTCPACQNNTLSLPAFFN